ncbi:uncharacterized protein si:dkey-195m11.11 isoform X1 [Triplophysa rosa]|nr:uncharacterized protein si:dkey-195m11.11 isoform X1 [Triplophysa rosa]
MIPGKRIAIAVMCWMMCLRLTASQGSLPVPQLSFSRYVNESNIQLDTKVGLECFVSSAPFPITMYIGRYKGPSQTLDTAEAWQISETIRYSKPYTFTITADSFAEDDIVCWYKSTYNGQKSGFSNPVKLVISHLPPPKVTVQPKFFSVGGNYTVYCDSTLDHATNFSMSLYYRTLPATPQTTLIHLGSLNLTGNDNRILVRQTNANIQVEYVCTMKMLYNGKVLHSLLSNFEAAIPEELPIQLVRNGRRGGCLGNLNIKLRDKWETVCQKPITADSSSAAEAAATAMVACRELGCGPAVDWKRVVDRSISLITTAGVRCSGSEKKIRECPTEDLVCRDINTLSIFCSDALPPPKLSVVTYGPVSTLYATDKQSVKITCSFSSPYLTSSDTMEMVFRLNGSILRDPYITINSSIDFEIFAPVPEGVYDCVFRLDRTSLSHASNSVVIYRHNPPDPVPIILGILTTVVGAAILLYICIFRTTKEFEVNEIPRSSCEPEATNTHRENNVNYLPQQL